MKKYKKWNINKKKLKKHGLNKPFKNNMNGESYYLYQENWNLFNQKDKKSWKSRWW
ncbi:unknown; predicted coding region [Mycoplasmopsis pulmonis]|uniref:Uncharacterized protein n=1 Tax=Mycoplasmopsis pulmonis (strain UAB CTIP) TaxID=272635 RepID=Q98RD7_MYCPU|nr:hypothetical protein [Mycoplasmopsis pulmonis]CAC13245.1 unknown; predicted coding region [Mycoplasmopsis pulmonis]